MKRRRRRAMPAIDTSMSLEGDSELMIIRPNTRSFLIALVAALGLLTGRLVSSALPAAANSPVKRVALRPAPPPRPAATTAPVVLKSPVKKAAPPHPSLSPRPAATTAPAALKPPVKKAAPRPPAPQLTPAQINQIMDFLHKTQPETYHKAQVLRRTDPKQFVTLINKAAPNFKRLEQLQKSDSKLFDMTLENLADTHKSFQIADELRQPNLPPAQMKKLQNELVRVVASQFELHQRIRTHELNLLLRRLNKLKAQFQLRRKQRAEIIQARVRALIGKPPSVNW